MGQVQHRARVTRVEDSLTETISECATHAAESETVAYQEGATYWKAFDENVIKILERNERLSQVKAPTVLTLSMMRPKSLATITVGAYI
jgi:hypothetical protein